MFSTQHIINDLRMHANVLNGPAANSLQRGADELERLRDELLFLRAYAEIPQEVQ